MKAFIYLFVCLFSCGAFSTAIKFITFSFDTHLLQQEYSVNLNKYRSAIVFLVVLLFCYVDIKEVFKFVSGNCSIYYTNKIESHICSKVYCFELEQCRRPCGSIEFMKNED